MAGRKTMMCAEPTIGQGLVALGASRYKRDGLSLCEPPLHPTASLTPQDSGDLFRDPGSRMPGPHVTQFCSSEGPQGLTQEVTSLPSRVCLGLWPVVAPTPRRREGGPGGVGGTPSRSCFLLTQLPSVGLDKGSQQPPATSPQRPEPHRGLCQPRWLTGIKTGNRTVFEPFPCLRSQ